MVSCSLLMDLRFKILPFNHHPGLAILLNSRILCT